MIRSLVIVSLSLALAACATSQGTQYKISDSSRNLVCSTSTDGAVLSDCRVRASQ